MTDKEIIQDLIEKGNKITKEFFFYKCRPLFCSVMKLVFDYEVEYDEHPILQMAPEGGRNLCEIHCEAYVLRLRGMLVDEEDLLEVAKDNHWIKRAGAPFQFMGNLKEYMGLKVSRRYGAHIEDIKKALENGDALLSL